MAGGSGKPLTLEDLRLLAREDLYVLLKFVLGYDRYVPEVHRRMCDELMGLKPDRWLMTLWPRGTFKSTTCSIGYPLWRIARDATDPTNLWGDSRGLIVCYSQERAKNYLAEIKGHLTNETSLFYRLFTGVKGRPLCDVPKGWPWTATQICVSSRKKYRKEPTISVCGLTNIPTGMHFDWIIFDDPVDPRLVDSEAERLTTLARFRDALPLMDPGGVGAVVGTRWHKYDLYGYIKQHRRAFGFTVLEKRAYDKNGKLNFPTILSHEVLRQKRAQLGARLFACNYLNDPIEDEERPFPNILWREPKQMPPDDYQLAVLCDPNDSVNKRADYTAIVVVAHARSRHLLFVCEVYMKRQRAAYTPRMLFDMAIRTVDSWLPRFEYKGYRSYFVGVVVEAFGFQTMIASELNRIMLENDRFFPVHALPRGPQKAKMARILGLKPRFDANGVFFNSEYRDDESMQIAVAQLEGYPGSDYDDFPDALAQANQIFTPIRRLEDIKSDERQTKTREQVIREHWQRRIEADKRKAFRQSAMIAALGEWFGVEG